MGSAGQVLILIAVVVPVVLLVWYVFSSLGRITRAVEDVAVTLRRIEQNERRGASS